MDLVVIRKLVRNVVYGAVFYQASMKLAPKLVQAVAKRWGVEIPADFK